MQVTLNRKQEQAVRHMGSPLLIIAGAGTGKTTVLTERIKWLITNKKINPSEILALTFTEKAAREMEERVDMILPYGYTQMWIMTFHSFGDRTLRDDAVQIGLDPGYQIMTKADSIMFLRKHLFSLKLDYFRPLGNPVKFIEGMLEHFDRLRDEDVAPDEYIRWVKSEARNSKLEKIEIKKYRELASAYKLYQELKAREGVMDFSDLITNTLNLFRKKKNVLRQYREQFRYLLIDEYQDTNIAQNELALLLVGKSGNITVVADDDQSIYRWRGAAMSNIIQFRKNFKDAKLVVLTDNYRSTQKILTRGYRLIQHNNPDRLEARESIDKRLTSMRSIKGDDVSLIYADRVENEADLVVKKIKDQREKSKKQNGGKKYQWKDFAILIRANNHAEPFSRALSRAGIPFQFLGPGMLFRQAEIRDLLSYLTLLDDISDSVACYRVLSMDIFSLSGRDIASLISMTKNTSLSLFEAVEYTIGSLTEKKVSTPVLSEKTKETLSKITSMVFKHLELTKRESAGQILYYFLEDTGYLKRLTTYKTVAQEKQAKNIAKFFDKIKSYEATHEDASIAAVLSFIRMSMELGESPLAAETDWMENDAVNILTVHSSKGLEFPVVFLVNLVVNRFPTTDRREKIPIPEHFVREILPEGDYHIQEERRLFYVGVTRARDKLYFSAARYYGEGKRDRKISPFVFETLGEEALHMTQLKEDTKKLDHLAGWKKEAPKITISKNSSTQSNLSYSQIATFRTCPLQYKYRYVLSIPIPPTAAASFGKTIHAVLENFYKKKEEGSIPPEKELVSYLKSEWIPVGYRNKTYEMKMFKRGVTLLKRYYKIFFDGSANIIDLEQSFKVKLASGLKVGGKIDRVDRREDSGIEVIDYKTGRRPKDSAVKKDLQMTVYALAAVSKYKEKPENVLLTFYFLEQGEKVSTIRSQKELILAEEKLTRIAYEIQDSSFPAKVGPWCDFCDFRLICEAWEEK